MKKLFVDTNIVVDLLARRQPFFTAAATIFSYADLGQLKLSTSALSIANTNYILLKGKKPEQAKSILRKLRLVIDVLALNDKIIGLALNDNQFGDFEDGIQYFTALENQQEIIITRNLKDFRNASLPVMTAQQFLDARV